MYYLKFRRDKMEFLSLREVNKHPPLDIFGVILRKLSFPILENNQKECGIKIL